MQARDYSRYAIEAVVIAGSILLALWVDASWESYQEDQREAAYLAGLAVEFENAAAELAADQRVRAAVMANMDAALVADEAGNAPTDAARLRASDPSTILNARFYTPTHANLDDLISSGSLQLLKSEALRLALLRYMQERDRVTVVEADYREYLNRNMEPYILEKADLGRYPPGTGPDVRRPLDLALWSDPAFVNRVWMARARLETVMAFAEGLERRISDVRQALAQP